MANKKRIATSVAAVATAAALLLGGTFAWQSVNQTALNEASDVINPGGRLHDDFNGENKDIYVENFADEPIYARIQLSEYFEIIVNYGKGDAEKSTQILGSKEDDGTYNYDTFYFDGNVDENGAVNAGGGDEEGNPYWTWQTGGSTVYMPTFNMNKDSLAADINGIYEGGNVGTMSDRFNPDDPQYSEYTNWAEFEGENGVVGEGAAKSGTEIYDADSNNVEETDGSGTTIVDATHTSKSTGDAELMSMQQWIAGGSAEGPYWVYDTDGWVYWAQAIEPDTATGLLLDSIELNQVMDDSWYYAINVVAQFVTADDVGKVDGTGFYVTGTEPTDEAETLLRTIGVTSVDDTSGSDSPEYPVEPESPLQLTIIPEQSWYLEGSSTMDIALTASATYEDEPVGDVSAISWSISDNASANTALSEATGSANTLKIGNNETANIAVTASFTYETEIEGEAVSETATETIWITNGPFVGSMVMFDADGNALYATSLYTAGADNIYNLYFFEKYLGNVTLYDKANAYSGEALELLQDGLTFAFVDEEGNETNVDEVVLTQNGTELTVSISADFTDTITIKFEHENWGQGSFTLKAPLTADSLQNALNNGEYIDMTGETITVSNAPVADDSPTLDSYFLMHNGGTLNGGTITSTEWTDATLFINNEIGWPVAGDGANEARVNGTTINAATSWGMRVQALDAYVTLNDMALSGPYGGLIAEYSQSNGTREGENTITLNNLSITAGSTYPTTGEYASYAFVNSAVAAGYGANVEINGGTYTGTNAIYVLPTDATITIYDGDFSGNLVAESDQLTIYGGRFTDDPSAYVAEDHEVIEEDGWYIVSESGAAVLSLSWQ